MPPTLVSQPHPAASLDLPPALSALSPALLLPWGSRSHSQNLLFLFQDLNSTRSPLFLLGACCGIGLGSPCLQGV